jgi:hypothetical protein
VHDVTDNIRTYEAFVKAKECIADRKGLDVADDEINPILKPFQRACVRWALAGGCRALFEAFGLGKSVQQLEICRIVLSKLDVGPVRHRALIICPLGVRQEFIRDSVEILGWHESPVFIQKTEHLRCDQCDGSREVEGDWCQACEGTGTMFGIFITNYESIREGKIDLSLFDVITLDEASVLRSFGSKTFGEFLFGAVQQVPYRFVATATPSPNEYQEMLAYAHFLGVMDIGQARTRFFKRNSEKSDDLTLHKHKEHEFWLWVASWALFLQRPSDLGPEYSDEGYELPELEIVYHELPVDHKTAKADKHGQGQMFRNATAGVSEASREKRDTLKARVARMKEIVDASPDDHFLVWHDLEAERKAIEDAIPETVTVYGSQKLDRREQAIIDFSDGRLKYLGGKPQMLGSGCNFQRHCHRAIYVGIGYKFNDFIQSIHRLLRYLQTHKVRIDIIFAESEKAVLEILLEKWERDKEQRAIMTEIIQKYGLAQDSMRAELTRGFGVEREAITGGLGKTPVNIDRKFKDQLEEIIGPDETIIGSAEGKLEWLNIHNQNVFNIYPNIGARKITCHFKPELRRTVIEAIDRYVIVHGTLRYKQRERFPYAADVAEIEVVPEYDQLPLMADLQGIAPNATGKLTADDYVQKLRQKRSI